MLKTVDEHNKKVREAREEREWKARLTGVACPKCGKELEWTPTTLQYTTFPPPTIHPAECGKCSLTIGLER